MNGAKLNKKSDFFQEKISFELLRGMPIVKVWRKTGGVWEVCCLRHSRFQ